MFLSEERTPIGAVLAAQMTAAVSCQFKIARYPFPSRRPQAPEPQCCSVLRLVPPKKSPVGATKSAKLGK